MLCPCGTITNFKACLTLSYVTVPMSYKIPEKQTQVHAREMSSKHLNLLPVWLWHAAGISTAQQKQLSQPPTL